MPLLNPAEIVGTTDFRDFLIEAKQNGYGSGSDRALETVGISGRKEFQFPIDPTGDFIYVDSFVGGNPYGGYEHISYRQDEGQMFKPIW